MSASFESVFDWRYALEQDDRLALYENGKAAFMKVLRQILFSKIVPNLEDSTIDPEPMARADLIEILARLREPDAAASSGTVRARWRGDGLRNRDRCRNAQLTGRMGRRFPH